MQSRKFSFDCTPEEGILLLTGARLLDKLVAGITIQACDRDELIKDIIARLNHNIPPALSGLSDEIADAILESVLGVCGLEEPKEPDYKAIEQQSCNYPMYAVDQTLPALEEAILQHKTVKATYYSFARESVDVIALDPLALIREEDLWKVVAYYHERKEIMIFRVDRIKELTATTEHFESPQNFNTQRPLPFL